MNIEQNIMLPYFFLLNSGPIVLKNLVVANWEIPNHGSIGTVLFIVGSVFEKKIISFRLTLGDSDMTDKMI